MYPISSGFRNLNASLKQLRYPWNKFILAFSAISLSSCLPGPGFYQKSQVDLASGSGAAIEAIMDGDKAVATVSALSSVVQTISAPSSSSMAGVSLAISPGTLQVDMAIGLEESVGLISSAAADEMGMSFDGEAGVAINLTNDAGVSDISSSAPPMQLNIPIFSSPLRLAGEDSSLVVFFRRAASSDSCSERIFPPSTFEKQGNAIAIGVRRFGAYQPLWVPTKELEMKEQEATDADGSFVIERQGCKVVTKAEEKKLAPVSISDVMIEKDGLVARFSAKVEGDNLRSCYLFGKDIVSGRTFKKENDKPLFKADFSGHQKAVDARVAIGCNFESGRNIETKFKSFKLGLDAITLNHKFVNDTHLRLSTDIDKSQVDVCHMVAKSINSTNAFEHKEEMQDPGSFDIHQIYRGTNKDHHDEIEIHIVCSGIGGGEVKSNAITVYSKEPPIHIDTRMDVVTFDNGNLDLTLEIEGDSTSINYSSVDNVEIEVCKGNSPDTCQSLSSDTISFISGETATVAIGSFSDNSSPNPIFNVGEDFYINSVELIASSNTIEKFQADEYQAFYKDKNEKVASWVTWFSVAEDSGLSLTDPTLPAGDGNGNGTAFAFTFTIDDSSDNKNYEFISQICWDVTDVTKSYEYCAFPTSTEWSGTELAYTYTYTDDSLDLGANSSINRVDVYFDGDRFAPFSYDPNPEGT